MEGAEIVKEINLDISEVIIDYIQTKKKVNVIEKSNYTINIYIIYEKGHNFQILWPFFVGKFSTKIIF